MAGETPFFAFAGVLKNSTPNAEVGVFHHSWKSKEYKDIPLGKSIKKGAKNTRPEFVRKYSK